MEDRRTTAEYLAALAARRKLDKNRCVRCSKRAHTTTLHVHHIIPYKYGGTEDIDNLITLCFMCHYEWEYIASYSNDFDFSWWLTTPPALCMLDLMFQALHNPDQNPTLEQVYRFYRLIIEQRR